MHHRGLSRFVLWTIALILCSRVEAGEPAFPRAGGKLAASQISPEAKKPLPPQSTDNLMPLHTASVLSWLCGDSTVQSALGKSKRGCYEEIWPLVSACAGDLQAEAPTANNRHPGARVAHVANFRAAYRQCLARKYAERQEAKGVMAPSIAKGEPDPLAARFSSGSAN